MLTCNILDDADVEELQEIVGTLKIDPTSGKASFFGQTAGMEVCEVLWQGYHLDFLTNTTPESLSCRWISLLVYQLLLKSQQIEPEESDVGSDTAWSLEPYDIVRDSALNPLLRSMPTDKLMEHLESQLPAHLRAWKLCEIYYSCVSWM